LANFKTFAQSEIQQLKLANSFEKNRDYEAALKIYKNLEKNFKTKYAVIQGIRNCLKGLMKYEELVSYMKKLVYENKSNDKYLNQLAEAHLMNSEKDIAKNIWASLINKKRNEIRVYRMVASMMIKNRLVDDAIEIYELALQNIKNQHILHLDLANLYKSTLNIEKATEHYLKYYEKYPKQNKILQRQILNLTKSEQHLEKLTGVLKNYINKHKDNLVVHEILAGLYIKSGEFNLAYDVYNSLEEFRKDGSYLFKFGKEAQKNKVYNFALESFENILQNKKLAIYDLTYFQLANTYYKIGLEEYRFSDTYTPTSSILNAIQMFENLVAKNSIKNFSDLSCLALGDIYLDLYFDLDKAIYYYGYLTDNFPKSKKYGESLIKLGDSFLIKGNLIESQKIYKKNKGKKNFSLTTFKLAELDYYSGNFLEALKKYNLILEKKGVKDTLSNNALERRIFINSFLSDTLDLQNYAFGELLVFQNKFSEAIEHFNKLLIKKKNISSNSGKSMVKILMKLEKYSEANIILTDLIEQFPDDYYADEFLFIRATIEEKMGNIQKSFELYQKLLNDFETSMYFEQAREKARALNERMKLEQVSG
jgi:tetratricopeptide (TPR) repeat protein